MKMHIGYNREIGILEGKEISASSSVLNGELCDEFKNKIISLVRTIDSSARDIGYYSDGSDTQRDARDKNRQAWDDLVGLLGT